MGRSAVIGILALIGCGVFSTTSSAEQLQISVQAPDGSAVEDLVVYAEPLQSGLVSDRETPPLQINQKNKTFAPYVSVIQRNSAVNFVNQDDITHHIYSVSGNNRFSFKIAAGETGQIIAGAGNSAGAEAVAMGCNIHDWMSGYLLVLDTPYYAKTDSQGRVALDIEQPGDYRVNVWHPQIQTPDHRMKMDVSLAGEVAFNMQLNQPLAPIPEQAGEEEFEFLEQY